MSVGTVTTERSSRRPAWRRTETVTPYLLLGPSLLLIFGLLGYPLYKLIAVSFQQFTRTEFFTRETIYNGVDNYTAIFADPDFGWVLLRTLVTLVVMVVGTMVVGTAVALLLQRLNKVARTVVSISLLFSWATPPLAAVVVWKWLLNSQYGFYTWLLELVGFNLRGDSSILFSGPKVLAAICVVVIWQAVPFVALTLYAGLTQVSQELYEAAELDGAGFWRCFTQVTVPMLRPIFMLLITLSVIWDFRLFGQVWVFNRGGPNGESLLIGSYSYFTSFVQYDFGQGSAVAVVMVLSLLVITAYYIRQMVRSGETS